MNVRREDMIGIGCAFAGAALGAFVAAPMLGGTPAVFTAIGVGMGWSVSKVIVGHLEQSELSKIEAKTRASQAENDADFAPAFFDKDEVGRK
jgi:hypothetical protein